KVANWDGARTPVRTADGGRTQPPVPGRTGRPPPALTSLVQARVAAAADIEARAGSPGPAEGQAD
ncbi:MAG: hypothetical protein OXC11_12355, partial [Rhodospirillales bacterium]|nr:hypothetical protein [Rhodospirillales bacterium]